jgi:hypothetical protein
MAAARRARLVFDSNMVARGGSKVSSLLAQIPQKWRPVLLGKSDQGRVDKVGASLWISMGEAGDDGA